MPSDDAEESIGIDDESPGDDAEVVSTLSPDTAAERFDQAFRAIYATFHRRDGTDRGLSNTSRAALTHLSLAGPLTVGAAAEHLRRSQSTTSEILNQLEGHGLVERRTDPDDARRTLVWLTHAGLRALRDQDTVLGLDLLTAAFGRLQPPERTGILDAMHLLLEGENHHG